jgi:CHAT domain-containing protein/predicted negative regulator of RcsB-dependent stress response
MKRQIRKTQSRLRFILLMLIVIFLSITSPTFKGIAVSFHHSPQPTRSAQFISESPMDRGKTLYETGQYAAAAEVLEQVVTRYRSQGNTLAEAVALSNLSLVYQELGRWQEAETAVTNSLQLLEAQPSRQSSTLAQIYDVQGQLFLSRGQADAALEAWQKSADLYQQANDLPSDVQSQINQAEALQRLGLYRRAIDQLDRLLASSNLLDPTLRAAVHRSLGDALRATGNFTRSEAELRLSLELAQQGQQPNAIAATQLSLANTLAAQNNPEAALSLYQQAVSGSANTRLRAQLNQVRLLVGADQTDTDQINANQIKSQNSVIQRLPDLISQIEQLPPSHTSIYARINLSRSLMQMSTPDQQITIAQLLSAARQQAHILGDRRAESFAFGTLGELYESVGQLVDAQQVTESALNLAQSINSADAAYLWQWQLGRVLKAQGKRTEAIAAYADAVGTLQLLRSDLVAINPEIQFSFRQGVEPVYREFVSLLLQLNVNLTAQELELARQTIESLQLAELDNFFREACLNAQPIPIDQVDEQAAVIYPIILPDRLEIILSLPQGGIRRYTVPVAATEVTRRGSQLQTFLRQLASSERVTPLAEQIYDWLIRPLKADLDSAQPTTLVFVLDGVLRNIPMSSLRDRDTGRYLIEDYAIALTPGLQLLSSQTSGSGRFGVLLGGLSESPSPDFSDLPGVVNELGQISTQVDNQRILLNDQFQNADIQAAIQEISFPIVHLATHGEFSSRLENTFILTWDNRITIDQLSQLLQASDVSRQRPIELLVLSACETAEGDDRAALGLAGVAVRSGARSTIASLWPLNDAAAPVLMVQFYQNLASGNVTRAEALRQAQLVLLKDPEFSPPYFWSAVVLVGNWQQL